MEVIQVQPRDFYLHYVYVPTKGSTIRWTFATRKNHIAFGLYRRLGHASASSSSILTAQQQSSSDTLDSNSLKHKGNTMSRF